MLIYVDYRNEIYIKTWEYAIVATVIMGIVLTILLVSFDVDRYLASETISLSELLSMSFAIIISIYGIGYCYGLSTKNSTALHDILLKEPSGSTSRYVGSRIIMILSHRAAFEHLDRVYVVPAGDIVRIETATRR